MGAVDLGDGVGKLWAGQANFPIPEGLGHFFVSPQMPILEVIHHISSENRMGSQVSRENGYRIFLFTVCIARRRNGLYTEPKTGW